MNLSNMNDVLPMAATVLTCVVPAAIGLGFKLQKIATQFVQANAEISTNLKVIEVQMNSVHEELKAARKARGEIWTEINGLRERVAKVESKNG